MGNYEAETQGEEKGKRGERDSRRRKNGSRGTQRGLQAQRDGEAGHPCFLIP